MTVTETAGIPRPHAAAESTASSQARTDGVTDLSVDRSRHPPVTAAIVAVSTAWTAWLLSRGWFYSDDFYNLTEARSMGFGWGYLTRDLFGHVVPGFMSLAWLVARPGGASYRWAAIETLAGLGAILALVGRVARALGASRRASWCAVALTAANAGSVGATMWWSASLHAVPGAIGGLAFVLSHLRWLEHGRARSLVAGALAFGLALSAQEGSIVFLILAVAVTAAWYLSGSASARLRGLAALWPAWAAYCVPLAAFGALWKVAGQGIGEGRPGPVSLMTFPFVTIANGFLPAQVGVSLHGLADRPAMVAGITLAALAAVVLRRWLRSTGPTGWYPVLIVAAVVAVRSLLVAWARYDLLGWSAAADQRYLADLTWVAPVVFAAAWSRRPPSLAPPHRSSDVPRRSTAAGTPALVALVVCVGVAGQATQAPTIGPHRAQLYRDRFASTYEAALAAEPDASVLDVAVGADLARRCWPGSHCCRAPWRSAFTTCGSTTSPALSWLPPARGGCGPSDWRSSVGSTWPAAMRSPPLRRGRQIVTAGQPAGGRPRCGRLSTVASPKGPTSSTSAMSTAAGPGRPSRPPSSPAGPERRTNASTSWSTAHRPTSSS